MGMKPNQDLEKWERMSSQILLRLALIGNKLNVAVGWESNKLSKNLAKTAPRGMEREFLLEIMESVPHHCFHIDVVAERSKAQR
jgi:hypothetical protein